MLTALKVALVAVLIVVTVAALGLFLVIRWFRRVAKDIADNPTTPPCRINPEPQSNPQWKNAPQIAEWSEQLRGLGFVDAGAFTVPEMAGLQLAGFCHPTQRLVALIYDHTKIAPTFDICWERPDATGTSGTNTTLGAELSRRPGTNRVSIENGTIQQVYDAVTKDSAVEERVAVSVEEFPVHFKDSYARSMNWTLKQGGVSRDDIRREAKRMNQEISEEQLDECYKDMREGYVTELRSGCLAQYLDESKLPASEWEKIRDRAFAVPETLKLDEIVEAIQCTVPVDEEQQHRLDQLRAGQVESGLEIVDRILNDNVATLGLKKVGEVQEPVRAYILLAP